MSWSHQGWPRTQYLAKAGLKLCILLPQLRCGWVGTVTLYFSSNVLHLFIYLIILPQCIQEHNWYVRFTLYSFFFLFLWIVLCPTWGPICFGHMWDFFNDSSLTFILGPQAPIQMFTPTTPLYCFLSVPGFSMILLSYMIISNYSFETFMPQWLTGFVLQIIASSNLYWWP